ncbi:hypothetical protein D9758_017231 [Tetrapyrgos nigripes]|uniref:Uncharacterized protein n=1 Tax=Tetrapyrgos nigripes TaxID=182062 RepID=A0A8H5C841_9AGAR|nr:hypothetical protein D9758_017231 [Tetrapyrgos nigripes]
MAEESGMAHLVRRLEFKLSTATDKTSSVHAYFYLAPVPVFVSSLSAACNFSQFAIYTCPGFSVVSLIKIELAWLRQLCIGKGCSEVGSCRRKGSAAPSRVGVKCFTSETNGIHPFPSYAFSAANDMLGCGQDGVEMMIETAIYGHIQDGFPYLDFRS